MLTQCVLYAFTSWLPFGRFQVFCAWPWRFCIVEVSWSWTLSLAWAARVGSWGWYVHVCFYCFLHLFQIFMIFTHKIVKFTWMFILWFFLLLALLTHQIVRGHYFFSTDFEFVWCLYFDEIAFRRFHMSAWWFGHGRCFFRFILISLKGGWLEVIFRFTFWWFLLMTVFDSLGKKIIRLIHGHSAVFLFFLIDGVSLVVRTLLKSLLFL